MHEIHAFLLVAARHLTSPLRSTLAVEPIGEISPYIRRSAGTFTTFDHLTYGAVYLRGELPLETELFEEWIGDFAWGTGGPMRYSEIAHILIPRYFAQGTFCVSEGEGPNKKVETRNEWQHEQDIAGLSERLKQASIDHSLTEWALEIKRF